MKKKFLLIVILFILSIQGIFLVFYNKEIKINDDSIKSLEKDKNIKEIFLNIDKINKLNTNSYNKMNDKWIGKFEFKGDLEETKRLINNIENFNINSYYIVYEDKNIYIEGLLEHK